MGVRRGRRIAAAAVLLAAAMPAQHVDWKFERTLAARLANTRGDEPMRVYFVMRDRIGPGHWSPRVRDLPLAARRAAVVADLRAHAARSQRPIVELLLAERQRGRCRDIAANWLGNFVCAEAHADVVRAVAARDDVWEVWPDVVLPPAAYEDGAPRAAHSGAAGCGPAGNGPAEVGADKVWAMGFTGKGVVIMNADSGVNQFHLSLRSGLWANPGEIIGNGIDDDGNGYIDDDIGWNFAANSPNVDDNGGHGTATAGVMIGNCFCDGTAYGIAPGAELMTGKLSNEVSQWFALQYAVQMGAHVQTSSHSYKNNFLPSPNYRMHREIADATLAAGLIRTNSTSNNGNSCQDPTSGVRRPFNVSAPGNVPSPYMDPAQTLVGARSGVIGVGAYDLSTRQLQSTTPCGPVAWDLTELLAVVPTFPTIYWSAAHNDYPWAGGAQLGLLKPDVVAPSGTDTTVGSGFSCQIRPFGGTSNATPVVAGIAALWKSANMSLTPEDVAMIVHQTADDFGLVAGKENTYGAGRVDAYAGAKLALAVHRVNGEPAWQVQHRSGTPVRLEVDGSAGKPVLILGGLSRTTSSLGPLTASVGGPWFEIACGMTDAAGDLVLNLPVIKVGAPVTIYTQAFVDDRTGPTGAILASNAIGIRLLP